MFNVRLMRSIASCLIAAESRICASRAIQTPGHRRCPHPQPRPTHQISLPRSVSAHAARSRESLVRPILPVPIKLITVSKSSGSDLAADYEKKISRYSNFSVTTIKPNPKGSADPLLQKEGEAERVLKLLTPRDYVVLLDERGREVTSEEMTDVLEEAGNRRSSSLVFVIGGPYGHGPAIYERGDDKIRLSKMVMNHQVAHVVLVEQIYRAFSILNGNPYHHV